MKESGLTRFLKGKKLPFVPKNVRQILRFGKNKRIVIDQDGNRKVVGKRKLLNAFNKVLAGDQKKLMATTLREAEDLTGSVMIGGLVRGKRKKYVSLAAAKRALTRRYGPTKK